MRATARLNLTDGEWHMVALTTVEGTAKVPLACCPQRLHALRRRPAARRPACDLTICKAALASGRQLSGSEPRHTRNASAGTAATGPPQVCGLLLCALPGTGAAPQAVRQGVALQGYQIWMDGLLMAQTDLNAGRPIVNVSSVVLCGRSDLATGRFFDGRIAHFTVYDQALDNNTVRTPKPLQAPRGAS